MVHGLLSVYANRWRIRRVLVLYALRSSDDGSSLEALE